MDKWGCIMLALWWHHTQSQKWVLFHIYTYCVPDWISWVGSDEKYWILPTLLLTCLLLLPKSYPIDYSYPIVQVWNLWFFSFFALVPALILEPSLVRFKFDLSCFRTGPLWCKLPAWVYLAFAACFLSCKMVSFMDIEPLTSRHLYVFWMADAPFQKSYWFYLGKLGRKVLNFVFHKGIWRVKVSGYSISGLLSHLTQTFLCGRQCGTLVSCGYCVVYWNHTTVLPSSCIDWPLSCPYEALSACCLTNTGLQNKIFGIQEQLYNPNSIYFRLS